MNFVKRILAALNISGRDLVGIAVSLALAFSIWLVHNLSQNYTKVVSVPLLAKSGLEGYSEKSTSSATVMARVRTRGFDLLRLGRLTADHPLELELPSAYLRYKDEGLFYVTAEELARYSSGIFGDNARVEAFLSDTLFYRFARQAYRRVPVEAVYRRTFRPQYTEVSPLLIFPDSVTIYGEPIHLDNIEKVYTQTLMLEDLHAETHGTVKLEKIAGVRLAVDKVSYSQDVTRYIEISGKIPVRVTGVPLERSLSVYPSEAAVSFKCVYPLMSDPLATVSASISYENYLSSLSGICVPKISGLPSGVISYDMDPDVFECVEAEK